MNQPVAAFQSFHHTHSQDYKPLADRLLKMSTGMQSCIKEAAALEAASLVKPLSARKLCRYREIGSELNGYDVVLADVSELQDDVVGTAWAIR